MILDAFRLTDRVAIVTGSGHGIGRAIALALADAGAHVVCSARTQQDIDETAAQVRAAGREALAVRCDVLETAQLENLAERDARAPRTDRRPRQQRGRHGPAAGAGALRARVREDRALQPHEPVPADQLVVPRMVKIAGSGAIVNISSGASVQVVGGMPYGGAKAGLDQMTRMLARSSRPRCA